MSLKKCGERIRNHPWVLLVTAAICVIMAIVLYMYPYIQGYERQSEEKKLALSYLQELQQGRTGLESSLDQMKEAVQNQNAVVDAATEQVHSGERWSDDEWYELNGVTYTPDYAAGTIDCVLIIPKIHLCRGVYTGTWDEIYHNLDAWMTTVARPDYILGETHYCVYGHNTPRLNLSFNRLQSLEEGDIFYLVNEDGAYQYQVTDSFGVSRGKSVMYTDDFSQGKEICYLITCGREEYRYLDLFVKGELLDFTDISDVDMEQFFYE